MQKRQVANKWYCLFYSLIINNQVVPFMQIVPYLFKQSLPLFLLLGIYSAQAQSGGTLSGTVRDSRSEAIAGATLIILNTNYSAIADNKGVFRIPAIGPGTYMLVVSAAGFATV